MMIENSIRARITHKLMADGLALACEVVTTPRHVDAAPTAAPDRCRNCGLTAAYPQIRFDSESVCSICRGFQRNRERVALYFRERSELLEIFERNRSSKRSDIDCLLLYSGGKDSTYALYTLVDMGLKVMTFTFDNGFISPKALANIDRITSELNVPHITSTHDSMHQVFRESLDRKSTVCNGCFKALLDLSLGLADSYGINYIVTGLSRGQIIDERLAWFYERNIFAPEEIDRQLAVGRKVYHRIDEYEGLRMRGVASDTIFDRVKLIDFYRYTDVSKQEIYEFLRRRATAWDHPSDCGFCSSNCMINDTGIYVHRQEQGYHNYEAPTAWEVRLGFITLEEAREELREIADPGRVTTILKVLNYDVNRHKAPRITDMTLYCVPVPGISEEILREAVRRMGPEVPAGITIHLVEQLPSPDSIPHATPGQAPAGHRSATEPPPRAPAISPPQGLEFGTIPLLPSQKSIIKQWGDAIGTSAATMLLELTQPLDQSVMKRGLLQMMIHHDAFRLRFNRNATEWTQRFASVGDGVPFLTVDLTPHPVSRHQAIIAGVQRRILQRIDLEAGPVVQFVFLVRQPPQPPLLMIAAHRLVMDYFSWGILLDDLDRALQQMRRGEPIVLPRKTASLTLLARRTDTGTLGDQAASPRTIPILPSRNTGEPGKPDMRNSASMATPAATVERIITHPACNDPMTLGTLLTEAVAAVYRSLSWPLAPLNVEVSITPFHRSIPPHDTNRTIGALSRNVPVAIEPDATMLQEERKDDPPKRSEQDETGPRGAGVIIISILPARHEEAPSPLLRIVEEPRPVMREDEGGLEIVAIVDDERLHMRWMFHPERHCEGTVAELADLVAARLEGPAKSGHLAEA